MKNTLISEIKDHLDTAKQQDDKAFITALGRGYCC